MKRILISVLLAVLSMACAQRPVLTDNIGVSITNSEKLLLMNRWGLMGRLSVRGGKRSMLSRLEWFHSADSDLLVMSTSLGGVAAKLKSIEGGFLLTDGDGYTRVIDHVELERQLGYTLPLQQLKYWVLGVADPSLPVSWGALTPQSEREFEQQGWLVRLERFTVIDGVVLPEKITVIKPGVKIKIVVEEWRI